MTATLVVAMMMADGRLEFWTTLDRSEAAIAEPITLSLEWSAPDGWTFELPTIGDRYGDLVRVSGDRRTATFEAYDGGRQTIPPLTGRFRGPNDETEIRTSGELSVRVRSAVSAVRSPTDLEPIVRVPRPLWYWVVVGIAVAAVLAAAGIGVRHFAAGRNRSRAVIRRLARIEAGAVDDPTAAAIAAAAVLRDHLAVRGPFAAAGQTDEELAERGVPADWPNGRAVADLLRAASAARFGGRAVDVAVAVAGVRAIRLGVVQDREGAGG